MPKISIITPCFFNELNIPVYAERMIENEKLFTGGVNFEYILIDDGSKDRTWQELEKFHDAWPDKVKIIKLVRNFSSTNAIFAGLQFSTGDCNVVISADLQDPPELIVKMYDYWLKGFKLVLANRTNREDSFLSSFISNITHNMVKKWALKNMPKGGFDMSLFDKELCESLKKIEDKNTFFPYLLLWLGYEYVNIPYTRRKRELGKSGYTLSKKIKTFVDSFVSFSFFPIRLISILGLVLGLIAFIYGITVIYVKLTNNIEVTGWSSMMVVVLFVSAFQMIAIGILGEYLWRTLDASRKRPNFIIEKIIDNTKEKI